MQSNLWYLFLWVRAAPINVFFRMLCKMKSIPRRNSRCSHFEWLAWCICTLLFYQKEKYTACSRSGSSTSNNNMLLAQLHNVIAYEFQWKKTAPTKNRKNEWQTSKKSPNEGSHVSIVQKLSCNFQFRMRTSIEIKELIPINFIAPVRPASAKWCTKRVLIRHTLLQMLVQALS